MSSWQALEDEVIKWTRPLTFWWRDDDAVADSASLQQLLSVARNYAVPVHLAVIPNRLDASLAVLKQQENRDISYVLQHGVEHKSFALENQRKIELGGSQDIEQLGQALSAGRERLQAMFTEQYVDILVPPWNRISTQVIEKLPAIGYRRLSVLGIRELQVTPPQLNVHIDIINWREKVFASEKVILSRLVAHLATKRTGANDRDEPCGLMTHHLDHDDECWQFLALFFDFCQQHPGIQWVGGKALYKA
ncbi:MAG: polysaccharide deacetylase family protein [Amphritea sp.]